MLTCPMCNKKVPALERECPTCHADLSLLVGYVENLVVGLAQAQALTREGRLGEAVWAYLEVLEVDPDNAVAREQVGRVVTAVREFDRSSPNRRWRKEMNRRGRFRRMIAAWEEGEGSGTIWSGIIWLLLVIAALCLGFYLGQQFQIFPNEPPAQTTSRQ